MVQVFRTSVFDQWLQHLKDRQAVARILVRLDRLALGHAGDTKSVGGGVLELRIDHGPGYRVYYAQNREQLLLLLCGGDKSTQKRDISTARELAAEWRNDD